ncbi:hypothetical protein [Natrialba sp. PRR66]|uniref:hypothetical protein n=1 Tax=Natrialba sp. PRR66 TaxID=3098146 RepID=UPI002B1CE676|nr:hypothetical protein [Natrialba sp. PRR66]
MAEGTAREGVMVADDYGSGSGTDSDSNSISDSNPAPVETRINDRLDGDDALFQ